jgi:hypothetical protein
MQLAEQLGEVSNDWEPGLPAVVHPHNPVYSEIQVIPEVDGTLAEQVWLQLAKPGELRARDLRKAFGRHRKMPIRHPLSPLKLSFDIDPPGQPYTCSLIAEVQESRGNIMNKAITALSIMRQIRLD